MPATASRAKDTLGATNVLAAAQRTGWLRGFGIELMHYPNFLGTRIASTSFAQPFLTRMHCFLIPIKDFWTTKTPHADSQDLELAIFVQA